MNTYDLNDRVAIVTGGAQGIGLAVAERMLESGAKVSIWDRDQTALDGITSRGDDRIQTLNVDIGDLPNVEDATQRVLGHFGKIDILINNAAIVGPNRTTWEYEPQDFIDIVHIGLIGTFFCCRTIVPHMIGQNYGRIVSTASIAGKEGNAGAPAYGAMKAGVIALTKSLGKELAKYNIGVNCVTPSVAATKSALAQDQAFIDMILSKVPRGRFLELSEAASMICWLASEENSFTTAGVFDLSGGRATY